MTTEFCRARCLVCLAAAQAQPAGSAEHWVATWGTAQQLAVETRRPGSRRRRATRTSRHRRRRSHLSRRRSMTRPCAWSCVRASAAAACGSRCRMRSASRPCESATCTWRCASATRRSWPAPDRRVTFGGKPSFMVQPGALVVSDPVELALPALAELAVSLYLPERTPAVTTHELGLNFTYVAPGTPSAPRRCRARRPISLTSGSRASKCSHPRRPAPSWRSATRLPTAFPARRTRIARGPRCSRRSSRRSCYCTLGRGQRGHLRQPSAARRRGHERARPLRSRRARPRRGRVDRAIRRHQRHHLLCAAGRARSERTTADELIEALSQLVDRAHARGIQVLGATLLPMGGLWLHNAETERMRQSVNRGSAPAASSTPWSISTP